MEIEKKHKNIADNHPLFQQLGDESQDLIALLSQDYRFSFSQMKQAISWLLDFEMWKETDTFHQIADKLNELSLTQVNSNQSRQVLFEFIQGLHQSIVSLPRVYPDQFQKEFKPKFRFEDFTMEHNKIRLCPAASPKTMICCNLKTINVVDNCSLGCSYCVLQNHYGEATIKVPTNLKDILGEMHVPPDKRMRVGTGEYSDSLLWGNRNNILADLMDFTRNHPNIILELKTKSPNIKWLLENELPPNLCVSWSMNPQLIIDHEERGTASLEQRLESARKLADKGVKVGFHFHPMMYFEGWEEQYQSLIKQTTSMFQPSEVLWVSFGVVTLMKGFANQFRKTYQHSKLLQMPMEETPEGKLTYPYDIRKALYQNAVSSISEWQGKVFNYLCMEHQQIWDETMPYTYQSVKEFDDTFNDNVFSKIG